MLITKTFETDKAEIYQLWQENFAFDDDGYSSFHFQHDYGAVDNYVLKENGELISCLQVIRHQMIVNANSYDYDFIVGVVTKEKYRNKGYMTKLVKGVLDKLEAAMILIQAYNPQIYRSFDFVELFHHKNVYGKAPTLKFSDYDYILGADAETLLQLYQQFTKDKSGYCYRDLAYYQRKKALLAAMGSVTVVIFKDNNAVGYFDYYKKEQSIKIDELIYLDTEVARAAVDYFSLTDKEITIKMMSADNSLQAWQKKTEELPATMAMFKAPEAINITDFEKQPLYFNEYE